MPTTIENGCLQVTWDDEGGEDNPFAGDLSDAPKVLMDNITHVRVWHSNPEWVEIIGRDKTNYKFVFKTPLPNGQKEVCPEDVWGVRLRKVRVEPQP